VRDGPRESSNDDPDKMSSEAEDIRQLIEQMT